MGGRGASGGISSRSAEFRSHYNMEMEDAKDFASYFAIEPGATKDSTGYHMYVYQDVNGRSLIADTQRSVDFLKQEIRGADSMGRSYGMSKDAIGGMKQALKEKVELQERAISAMKEARPEYEKYMRGAAVGNERGRRSGGRWM